MIDCLPRIVNILIDDMRVCIVVRNAHFPLHEIVRHSLDGFGRSIGKALLIQLARKRKKRCRRLEVEKLEILFH